MLQQYEVLEKRFRLTRKRHRSKWGSGIGERFTLEGDYRGYPVSLYDHFHGGGRERIAWTSLVLEVLFAELLELDIVFASSSSEASFGPPREGTRVIFEEGGLRVWASEAELAEFVLSPEIRDRLLSMAKRSCSGVVRLSKGFLEYREKGFIKDDSKRAAYQDALILLADLADQISIFKGRRKGARPE